MDDIPVPIPSNPVRFMDQLRAFIRSKHLAYKTEKAYCRWVLNFIRFHGKRHPNKMGAREVDEYLSYLSVARNLAVNSQKTALNALVFLYQKFLKIELGDLNFAHSTRPKTLPTVFSHAEAKSVLSALSGIHRILAGLMYGSGLRVMEAVRLRVQDIDFANDCIVVREAKHRILSGHPPNNQLDCPPEW